MNYFLEISVLLPLLSSIGEILRKVKWPKNRNGSVLDSWSGLLNAVWSGFGLVFVAFPLVFAKHLVIFPPACYSQRQKTCMKG